LLEVGKGNAGGEKHFTARAAAAAAARDMLFHVLQTTIYSEF
jgi:hypothetical protein